jgi:uncharacterized delta-60 repeat protein
MSTTIETTTETAQPGRSPRVLRAVLRLLPAAVLLASQVAVAAPAQAKAGDLDGTFGTGGKVTTDFGGPVDGARALAVQADGKLVAAGYAFGMNTDFALARYNSDGTLDTSFGTGGKVTTDFGAGYDEGAYALAAQADGKLLAAGQAVGTASLDFALARYNPDGTLDPSFGTGGKVTTDFAGEFFSSNDLATALAVQADGRLVAAGFTDTGLFALARYNSDGSLDSTFGTGGQVTTRIADFARAFALAVQPDGKLVAAGWAAGPSTGSYDFALARYNSDGTLDSTFGTGGQVTTDFGAGQVDEAHTLIVQGSQLVAAGTGSSLASGFDFALARYNSDGTLDPGFGTGGTVTTDMGVGFNLDEVRGLVMQGSKLVALGATYTGSSWDYGLARYRANGTLDPSFGTRGKVITDFAGGTDSAYALAMQADGKLVAAGDADTGFGPHFALARYRAR